MSIILICAFLIYLWSPGHLCFSNLPFRGKNVVVCFQLGPEVSDLPIIVSSKSITTQLAVWEHNSGEGQRVFGEGQRVSEVYPHWFNTLSVYMRSR